MTEIPENFDNLTKEELDKLITAMQTNLDNLKETRQFLEKFTLSTPEGEERAIQAGFVVTEEELDRRIEAGELTPENAKEFLEFKVLKYKDGTYGVWED